MSKGGEIEGGVEIKQVPEDGDLVVMAPTSDLSEGQKLRAAK